MSRAAASKASKEAGKANAALKAEEKAREKSLGMTGIIKDEMKGDQVLCSVCGATSKGGTPPCECKGGKVKLPAGDDGLAILIAAASARIDTRKAANMAATSAQQGEVVKQRAKNKEARDRDMNDMSAEFQGDGIECMQVVEFSPGKLGFQLEKNAVSSVGADGQALELKIQKGWIIHKVNDEEVEKDKAKIGKAVMQGMKKGPVKFVFRVPITDGFVHCTACDKFMGDDQFDGAQLRAGPGKQMCAACEEFGDCGDFGD